MKSQLFVTLLLLIIATTGLQAQNYSAQTERADEVYESGEYFLAIEKYMTAYAKVNNKSERGYICFQLGECYRQMSMPEEAETWYKHAIEDKYQNSNTYLYYAEALKMNGKYDKALEQYQAYKQLVPNDPMAQNGIESCQLAKQWLENPTRHIINEVEDLNSEASDFSPVLSGSNTVVFTSSREAAGGTEFNYASGQNSADLFFAMRDNKNKWSEPVPLYGEVNTEIDEGTATFSPSHATIFFTRCDRSKKYDMGCKIFTAHQTDSLWTNVEELKIIEDTSLTVGHPALSPDGLTLYFASDIPEGHGGKDIWMLQRDSENAEWGNPVNPGTTINTPGDEMFPYVKADGTLYFSSDYHVGMGGLDIFKATKENNVWIVENMQYPINTHADDFGIAFNTNTENESGYFSSSREGGSGGDDIYSFELPPLQFDVIVTVTNQETGEVVQAATVKMDGSDGSNLQNTTNAKGQVSFDLQPETDYSFVASKENFLNGKNSESTKGLEEDKTLYVDLEIIPMQETIELPNIEYDLNKWDLRPESMVSLDKLVQTLKDNPRITIELGSHTDFRGSDASNETLSQNRAQSVVDYLISKGIAANRLVAKGYGEYQPKTVNAATASKHDFLSEGDVLNEAFINNLNTETQKEIAHQLNRRTEFRVLSTNYVPSDNQNDEIEIEIETGNTNDNPAPDENQ